MHHSSKLFQRFRFENLIQNTELLAAFEVEQLPVAINSIAFDLPTIRTSRCVPPVPGNTPSETSGSPNLPASFARDANVRRHRDFQTTTDAVSIDRGNHEFRCLFQTRKAFRSHEDRNNT